MTDACSAAICPTTIRARSRAFSITTGRRSGSSWRPKSGSTSFMPVARAAFRSSSSTRACPRIAPALRAYPSPRAHGPRRARRSRGADRADAQRFEALGARNVDVIGNVKFDAAVSREAASRGRSWRASSGGRASRLARGEHPRGRRGAPARRVRTDARRRAPRHRAAPSPALRRSRRLLDARKIGYGVAAMRRGRRPAQSCSATAWARWSRITPRATSRSSAGACCPSARKPARSVRAGKPVIVGPAYLQFPGSGRAGVAAGGAVQVAACWKRSAAAVARDA